MLPPGMLPGIASTYVPIIPAAAVVLVVLPVVVEVLLVAVVLVVVVVVIVLVLVLDMVVVVEVLEVLVLLLVLVLDDVVVVLVVVVIVLVVVVSKPTAAKESTIPCPESRSTPAASMSHVVFVMACRICAGVLRPFSIINAAIPAAFGAAAEVP